MKFIKPFSIFEQGEVTGDFEEYDNKSGKPFWGNVGAGILPICTKTKRILVPLRSTYVNEPGTWGVWGGKLEEKEDKNNPLKAAHREFREEAEYRGKLKLIPSYVYKTDGFEYHNFIGVVPEEFEPELNWETEKFKWVTLDELKKMKLHFGLKELLEKGTKEIETAMHAE